MVADLKRLELLPVGEIGNSAGEGVKHIRVASIDSPFREYMVTWSFLQISCRPGVPPRDMASVIDLFVEVWKAQQKTTPGSQTADG
jgi:hypothetical protein